MSGPNCLSVSPACPVSASIYGYYPSLPANAFFCAFFGLALVANLILGTRYKTWTFMIALALGSLTECVGYVGRILMHGNPFSNAGFEMQICCLIMAPAFISAAIYVSLLSPNTRNTHIACLSVSTMAGSVGRRSTHVLFSDLSPKPPLTPPSQLTLKHLTLTFGPQLNRFPARYYTWAFISADIFSLVLQGSGGGIAATANPGSSLLNVGTDLMLTGIVLQVITLLIFGGLAADFALRLSRDGTPFTIEAATLKNQRSFRLFLGGLALAFLAVFTRCVYRIAEMAGGWSNAIMQNESDFIALDGVMVVLATAALTLFHPGYCFPRLSDSFSKGDHMGEKAASQDSWT